MLVLEQVSLASLGQWPVWPVLEWIEMLSILQGVLERPVSVALVWVSRVLWVFLVPSVGCFQRLVPVSRHGRLLLVGHPPSPHQHNIALLFWMEPQSFLDTKEFSRDGFKSLGCLVFHGENLCLVAAP